jgi:Uma2 family endonuclease
MVMPALVPRYTVEHLESFPEDGNRYELLDGMLLVTPAPNPPHQVVVLRLRRLLDDYLGDRAHVFTRGVVQIPPYHHLEPDLLVVPVFGQVPKTWANLPDLWLAVEVSGRHSRVYDRDFKHRASHQLGVGTVWRIDLLDRTATYSSREQVDAITTQGQLEWPSPASGDRLQMPLARLFAGTEDGD